MTSKELIETLWDSPGGRDAREATRAVTEISGIYRIDARAVARALVRHLAHLNQLGLLSGTGTLDQDLMVGLTAVELVRGRIANSLDRCDAALAHGQAIVEMAQASLTELPGKKQNLQG